jgi:hypothetical protein
MRNCNAEVRESRAPDFNPNSGESWDRDGESRTCMKLMVGLERTKQYE